MKDVDHREEQENYEEYWHDTRLDASIERRTHIGIKFVCVASLG